MLKPHDILPDAPADAVVPPTDDERGVWTAVNLSAWEYARITELLQREPNALELELFGVMWSEHCSYKNTRALLRRLPVSGPRIVQGPGENAGAIRVGNHTVVFKIESHNYPSAVDPYNGAATGVGGILRDIFTMGARPIALLDSTRFGPPAEQLQRDRLLGAVAGMADYAATVGVPNVGGEGRFGAGYRDNPLVNAMAVGVTKEPLAKGLATGSGNPLLVFGRPTGRDGVRSASLASKDFVGNAGPPVPRGDADAGRRLMEATLALLRTDAIVGMQDMGAAGFTSSACEMAARAGTGIEIDVQLVPKVDADVQPVDVMLSETQERMLAVVRAGHEETAAAIVEKYGLAYGFCGRVTDDGYVRVKDGDELLAEVPAAFLADEAPCYVRPLAPLEPKGEAVVELAGDSVPDDFGPVLRAVLARPNLADRRAVRGRYGDENPGGPGAAVVRIDDEQEGAIVLCTYGNGRHVALDAFTGTQGSVAAAARQVAATGAVPVAITNGLNYGNPANPVVYRQLEQTLSGMADACRALGTPVTGGNVSLFNETDGEPVPPTPIIGMVGVLAEPDKAVPAGFRQAGNVVLLLGETKAELHGSEYAAMSGNADDGAPPVVDLVAEQRLYRLLAQLADLRLLQAARAVVDGGLAVALAHMAFAAAPGAAGCRVTLAPGLPPVAALFSESHGRVVVEATVHGARSVIDAAAAAGVPCRVLGRVADGVMTLLAADETRLIDGTTVHFRADWEGALAWATDE